MFIGVCEFLPTGSLKNSVMARYGFILSCGGRVVGCGEFISLFF